MPYYQRLIDILRVAPHRVTTAGEIHLTDLEARLLRDCEFPTAVVGPWKIPPIPEVLVRANGLPLRLAEGHSWAGEQTISKSAPVVEAPSNRTAFRPPYRRDNRTPVERIWAWWRFQAPGG
jgi:hypothetical protein